MPFLRNILKDLVDKRLWPVALLLVGALVAVPVVLGRSGGDTAAPPPAPIADAAPGSAAAGSSVNRAAVSLDTEPSDRRHLDGKVRDPFSAPNVATKKAAPKTTTAADAAPAPVATSPTPSSPSSGSASAGAGATAASTGAGTSSGSTPSKPATTTPRPKTTK